MFVSENMICVDNLISIKKFGSDLYKIVLHKKPVRMSGYELENTDDENILDVGKFVIGFELVQRYLNWHIVTNGIGFSLVPYLI